MTLPPYCCILLVTETSYSREGITQILSNKRQESLRAILESFYHTGIVYLIQSYYKADLFSHFSHCLRAQLTQGICRIISQSIQAGEGSEVIIRLMTSWTEVKIGIVHTRVIGKNYGRKIIYID